MKTLSFRRAIAMIELVFAIVVISIVMLSIPMIIRVMNQAQELSVGQEMFAKMYAQAKRKSLNPWDEHVSDVVLNPDDTNGTILWVGGGSADLNCSRLVGLAYFRNNAASTRVCNQAFLSASPIPPQDGNLSGSRGIEQYNDETVQIFDAVDGNYSARIVVGYVSDAAAEPSNGHLTATWELGNDGTGSGAGSNPTHLKRVVMTFTKTGKPTSTFTFFMSNIGVVQ